MLDRMDVGAAEWGRRERIRHAEGEPTLRRSADPDHPGSDRAQAGRHHVVLPPEALSAVLSNRRAHVGIKVAEATGTKNADGHEASDNINHGVDMKNIGKHGGTAVRGSLLEVKTHTSKNFLGMVLIESTDNDGRLRKAKEVPASTAGHSRDRRGWPSAVMGTSIPSASARSTWPPDRSTRSSGMIPPPPARPRLPLAAPHHEGRTSASRVTILHTARRL